MDDELKSRGSSSEVLLKTREAQLALVFDTVADVVFMLTVTDDDRFVFSSINKRFLEATGLREQDVLGKYVEEVIPEPARALVLGKYRQAIRTGRPVSWEETSAYPAGVKIGEVTVAPVIQAGKPCRELVGTVHDVTEYRRINTLLEITEERWRLALEGSGAGVWDWNMATNHTSYSRYWKTLLGHEDHEIGTSYSEWESRLHPDDKTEVSDAMESALRAHRPVIQTEHRLRHKAGHWIWVRAHGMISYDGSGRAERMIGTIVDVTVQREAEAASQLAASVYKNSSEAMAITDASGIVIAINDAFANDRRLRSDDVIGKPLQAVLSHQDASSFTDTVRKSLATGGRWQGEVWRKNADGELVAELCTIDTVFDTDGSASRHIYLFLDITERKQSEERIWRQANFDSLTELPNRRYFVDRLMQAIRAAQQRNETLSLLIIDLDRFKEVNDALGHSSGDQLLIDCARRLCKCVENTDMVARFGGDEFAILLKEGTDEATMEVAVQRILQALSVPFDIDGNLAFLTASVGSARYPADAIEVETLIKYADQAMYAAKRAGGKRHSRFLAEMEHRSVARTKMVTDLHLAISSRQLRVHYQPIVDLGSHSALKAEALVRWLHPEKGFVSPVEFIPLAEEIGMIETIGNWVFDEAIRQCAPYCNASPFELSINVSPVQFRGTDDCLSELLAAIDRYQVPPSSLVVEVTEGVLMSLDTRTEKRFAALSDMGIRFSLDDFGTGYSSMSYITRLKFDYLKIDRVFVRNLAAHATSLALCETMISMAHKLGMKVIAEGIETSAQCKILTDAGCDYGQGFLFAKAMPFDEFEAFLKTQ